MNKIYIDKQGLDQSFINDLAHYCKTNGCDVLILENGIIVNNVSEKVSYQLGWWDVHFTVLET